MTALLTYSDGTNTLSCKTFGSQNYSLTPTEYGYLLKSDSLTSASFCLQSGERTQTGAFTTDASEVEFHIHDVEKLTVSAQGTPLILVANFEFGDVNKDGSVNASDAADVLIAAANIGAGADSGLDLVQEQAADYSQKNGINAEDAAMILMEAVRRGAGN